MHELVHHELISVGKSRGDLQADIIDDASISQLFDKVGPVDAIVSVTGLVHFGPLSETSAEHFNIGLQNKLLGQVRLALIGQRHLNDGGSITLTSGICSHEPIAQGSNVTTVNAAVDAFVLAAATELKRGQRINAVSPSIVTESSAAYGPFFPGFNTVDATLVTQGLPPQYKTDRGPGSSENLNMSSAARPPVRVMTPSYAGQSKATVESSHPRRVKDEDEPHYVASNLTPVELVRREIRALIRYNHTADMSERIPMDRELAFVLPTPHELWKYYDRKLRNSGVPMTISNAVREFLTPIALVCTKDGVYLDSLKYSSEELKMCGLLDRVARLPNHEIPIDGYMVDLCIRYMFVEVDNEIMLLEAQLPIRADEETLYIAITELAQWKAARANVGSRFRVHMPAAYAESLERFEAETGKSWDGGVRRPGRAKKTATARQEASEVKQHTSRRKSAW